MLRWGPAVAFGAVRGAAVRRPRTELPHRQTPGTFVPRARDRPLPAARSNAFPEIDCVRHLLPRRIIAAAEQRAQSIGIGADSVLICADAMTEEAYLRALPSSLGTSYERLDRVARADCPLDDNQLIQAGAAGLLPLRERNGIVWIIAPRCLTARRLADPRQSRPGWLRSFRLTSSERLARFVAQHSQNALGRRAADGLRRSTPLFSNAPRPHGIGRITAIVLGLLAVTFLAVVPAATVEAFATSLCSIFMAAALRLFSVAFAGQELGRTSRVSDDKLPIYTIICALYREANVVDNLVAA